MLGDKPDWCARIFSAILILFIATLAWLSVPQQPTQGALPDKCKTTTEPKNNSKTNENSANSLAALGSQQATPDQTNRTDFDKQIAGKGDIPDYNCQLAIYTAQLATYTELLVAATILLGLIGAVQGFYIRRSVIVAEHGMTTLERPFVFVSRLDLNHSKRGTNKPHFHIGLRNHGRTPAIMTGISFLVEFTNVVTLAVDGRGKPESFRGAQDLSNVIGANTPFEGITIGHPLIDSRLVDMVRDGAIVARVRMTIAYRDIFGRTHTEPVDFMYDVPSKLYLRTENAIARRKERRRERDREEAEAQHRRPNRDVQPPPPPIA